MLRQALEFRFLFAAVRHMGSSSFIQLQTGDALIAVDVQNDFLPGGSLAVPEGDAVVPALNRYVAAFGARALPVYATRDWHPPDHCSFNAQGGIWPPHCVAATRGAEFAGDLALPPTAVIISKAATREADAYSGFAGTDLAARLRAGRVTRLFIGGLATDYCVLNTVRDALAADFDVLLLADAIRAVDVHPGDGARALGEMQQLGARPIRYQDLAP
jgi:nicotinamidase/pyrazinamidase